MASRSRKITSLSSVRSLKALEKFINDNKFLYEADGTQIMSQSLRFRVSDLYNYFYAVDQDDRHIYVLLTKEGHEKSLKEEERRKKSVEKLQKIW